MSQIFVVINDDEPQLKFALYSNGLALFSDPASAGARGKWRQARLSAKATSEVVGLLDSSEFAALAEAYYVPTVVGSSFWLCGISKKGRRVEAEFTGKKVAEDSDLRGLPRQAKELPSVVSKLLALVKSVEHGRSAPWRPKWVDLSLSQVSSLEPAPGREIPSEWLNSAVITDSGTLRIRGNFEPELRAFVEERAKAAGPGLVGGIEYSVSLDVVLPGFRTCEPLAVEGATTPAMRFPGERPPRETSRK